MITEEQLPAVREATVYDAEGSKIGKVGHIYLDDDSGEPGWVTVNTGHFGGAESFVPLERAVLDGRELKIPYGKEQVKGAPRIGAEGHLDLQDAGELWSHYHPGEEVAAPEADGSAAGSDGAGDQGAPEASRSAADQTAQLPQAAPTAQEQRGSAGDQPAQPSGQADGDADGAVHGRHSAAGPRAGMLRRYVVVGPDAGTVIEPDEGAAVRQRNVAAQARLGELLEAGRIDDLGEVFADDVLDHDPTPGQAEGLAGIKAYFRTVNAAFPDSHTEVDRLVADGDTVAVTYRLTGTHDGDFMGVPATGHSIEVRGLQVSRFVDGRIVERWGSTDELGILRQIGATVSVSA